MRMRHTSRIAAGAALLIGALLVPTAAAHAAGPLPAAADEVTTTPQDVDDYQPRVGETTPSEALPPGMNAEATWSIDGLVVGDDMEYTPSESDRGQVLRRTITITSPGGRIWSRIQQTFVLPVV